MEYNRIYNCDCVDGMVSLPDGCIDVVVTSPPYDGMRVGYTSQYDMAGLIHHLYRTVKDGGVVVWVCKDETRNGSESLTSFRTAISFTDTGFNLYDTMIWEKPSPPTPTEGRYYDVFEYMFVFSKGVPKTRNLLSDRVNLTAGAKLPKEGKSSRDRRYITGVRTVHETSRRFNVWHIPQENNKTEHPAVFPIKIAADHIMTWSNGGDLVCDPFMGSGTTAVAAMKLGRNFIGFELKKEYCDIANKRIEENRDLFTMI